MSAQEKVDAAVDRGQNDKAQIMRQLEAPSVLTMLRKVAPSAHAEGLARVAYTAITKNPSLLKCTPGSLVAAVIEAAQLGLSVDGVLGHAYLVPYFDRGQQKAQMQLGYRGMTALAYRSGKVERISAAVIHAADVFEYQEGSDPRLLHRKPLVGDRGDAIGAFAVAHLFGSQRPLFRVMRIDEIESRRDRSSGWRAFRDGKIKSTPWDTDREPMIRKTLVRELSKLLPLEQLQRAAIREEQREIGVIDAPSEPAEVVAEVLNSDPATDNGLLDHPPARSS